MNETVNTQNEGNETQQAPKKIEITVVRHKQFFDMLKEPEAMWRVLLSIFFLVVIIVVGLSMVVLAVKRFYPYNTIETNLYGATIMKDENKDVIYWLFNTAELWANSGIEVKEGDELTIRASGASHTAIHHLVDAARQNDQPIDNWVGTEGQPKISERDCLRSNYRIVNQCDEGRLLMKVISHKEQNNKEGWIRESSNNHQSLISSADDVEIIGKERVRLRVKKDGILHFAVNDIVLSNEILDQLYCDYLGSIKNSLSYFGFNPGDSVHINNAIKSFKNIDTNAIRRFSEEFWNKFAEDSTKKKDTRKQMTEYKLSIGGYPGDNYENFPFFNELLFYKQKHFWDAWYVDNLGSFLIVIERKR